MHGTDLDLMNEESSLLTVQSVNKVQDYLTHQSPLLVQVEH